LSNARPKNNVNKVPRWVFRYVGNKTFDFSRKKRIFCPKTTKFGPKWAVLVNLGQAMQAYSMPCWWVGVWLCRGPYLARHLFTLSLPQKHRICLLTQPEVVTMAKKFVTTLKGCNNGKIKLLQRLQVVTMAN